MNINLIAKKSLFALKKASPTIAVVGGVAGGIYAAVKACKRTLYVDAILDEAKKKVEAIHEVADNPENAVIYPENKKHHDLALVYLTTGLKLLDNYKEPLIVGGLSIASILGGHFKMVKRAAALGAAATVATNALRSYRKAVQEEIGPEKETDIYYGLEKTKVEETFVDETTGKEKTKKVDAFVVNETKAISPDAMIFDIGNPNYVKGDPNYNVDFLTSQELWLTQKLERQGWLFENEARMALGYKPTKMGQVRGWIYDPDDPTRANCVDLGISHISRPEVRDFRNGVDKVFIIDLNTDGVILDDFYLFDKSHKVA